MACTKQTPRNPVLERPSAAMGSDVQERRVPTKPTTKKIKKRRETASKTPIAEDA